jgi:ParB/RepB/Spo0J family partition protein
MEIKEIKLNKIEFTKNIRIEYQDMAHLMKTIKDVGLLQPVGVKETSSGYLLLWGHRRVKAFEKLGYKTIPAVMFRKEEEELTEEEVILFQTVENFQRKANSLEELGRVCKLLRNQDMSISEIAAKLSIPKAKIKNALEAYTAIPLKWRKKINVMDGGLGEKEGNISITAAAKVAHFKMSDEAKDTLYRHIAKEEVPVGDVAAIGSLMRTGKSFNDSVKILNQYKAIEVHFFVDKKKWADCMNKFEGKSYKDFVVDLMNSKIPGLAISSVDSRGRGRKG